jgi:16S rRNA (cytidine1402-2'-O)-methyltransferase
MSGKLYVVATPIGNLADFSYRAIDTLKQVDVIAAEDTRHIIMLLQHYGISKPLVSLHQHNEEHASKGLLERLQQGQSIALVSDAGTPLLSDPGLPLVKLCKQHNITVVPIPGACALITALSASGMPVSRFSFEGFLARTSSARKTFFQQKLNDNSTWIFYESSHRIEASLADLAEVFPAEHPVAVARELTKMHETIVQDTLANILAQVKADENMRKGEFVVIVGGVASKEESQLVTEEQRRVLSLLMKECSIKSAVSLAVELTGQRKKILYQLALELQAENING